ncbi:hypothetical protein HNR28_001059 [Castellaniella defragrans]|uniref:Uncharacterized protein n=1 Tax=Castellaniella defragrans TaxID=75697 RepID=A0A7W9TM09_CASDE|nr:hypothetical protein [Castellaniella defragrans]
MKASENGGNDGNGEIGGNDENGGAAAHSGAGRGTTGRP